jgi:DNA-binding response OmpR family regulator
MADEGAVLIVEDDEPLRRILARHLRGRGFRVAEARSTEDAAATLEDGLRPDLVLLDLNLPGDSGWALLERPSFLTAGSPPVVIASATRVSPRRLAEANIAGFVPKPFPIDSLMATVERLIGQREPADAG